MAAGCDKGRIAFANETNSTTLGKKAGSSHLNGDLIKKFASGGDVISARLLHKNPSDHVFVATMFLCMNSIPDCSRPDTLIRTAGCLTCCMYLMKLKRDRKLTANQMTRSSRGSQLHQESANRRLLYTVSHTHI